MTRGTPGDTRNRDGLARRRRRTCRGPGPGTGGLGRSTHCVRVRAGHGGRRPRPTRASGLLCGCSGASPKASRSASARTTATSAPAAATTQHASRCGCPTSTFSVAARPRPAAGWPGRSELSRRSDRRPWAGGGSPWSGRGTPQSVQEQIAQAQRAVEIARARRRRPRGVRTEPARAGSRERRESGRRAATARGGDGGRVVGAGAQRAHPRRGLLQPHRGLRERRRVGTRDEWCELVSEFALTHKTEPLFGACRTVHANVLLATGQWPQAEDALEGALAIHARNVPQMSAPAVAALAELRVLRGRLLDAERLLRGREEEPASLRALALLRLAEGRPGGGRTAAARPARHGRTTPSAPLRSSRRWSTPASSAATRGRRRRRPPSCPRCAASRHPPHRGVCDLAAARVALAAGRPPTPPRRRPAAR